MNSNKLLKLLRFMHVSVAKMLFSTQIGYINPNSLDFNSRLKFLEYHIKFDYGTIERWMFSGGVYPMALALKARGDVIPKT
jgi:hypothetical protein